MPTHQRLPPTVAVIHPDETMLNAVQCALEQRDVPTVVLMPGARRGMAALTPYLPGPLRVCVYGLSPPRFVARALRNDLTVAYPDCSIVLMAADPAAALAGWRGLVYSLVPVRAELDRTVAAIVDSLCAMVDALEAAVDDGGDGERPAPDAV